MRAAILLASLCAATPAQVQPPTNGPAPVETGWHALVGGRVIAEPGRVLDNAMIVIRDGRILSVEIDGVAPKGARVWDVTGKTVHAAWIDSHVPVDAPTPDPEAPDSHWHADVMPQRSALDGNGLDENDAAALRRLGFGAAAIVPNGGIFRGRAAAVTLESLDENRQRHVIQRDLFQSVVFGRSRSGYPRSLMGSVALVRQTFADAGWHASQDDRRSALGELVRVQPVLFGTRDEVDALRAVRVLTEAGRSEGSMLLGSGLEFRRLAALAETGMPVVLPIDFPKAPDVDTLRSRSAVSLRQLQTWELAPTNPARLQNAGVRFALTTDRLESRADFFEHLRSAIRHGLSERDALAALTTTPAALLGLSDQLGSIDAGKLANLVVIEGSPFGKDRRVRDVWVRGERHEITRTKLDLDGTWTATMTAGDTRVERLELDGRKLKLVSGDKTTAAGKVHRGERSVEFSFDAGKLGGKGVWTANALITGDRMHGVGATADGDRFAWTARRVDAGDGDETAAAESAAGDDLATRALPTPLGAYGFAEAPAMQTVAVRNTTLWTSGPSGIIRDGTLIVVGGKVLYAGESATAPEIAADVEIDGKGLHVTPGLLDCHSHTGIDGGVNEGTQAVSAEVRIRDVLDPDDINWYRQLAGGITAVNQLHGSANPIGGQSQTTKLRWGIATPDAMHLEDATPGIKFALGENVKRSRSSDNTRYPNTRMGVEGLIRERFWSARAYLEAQQRARVARTAPPRRDLELEALGEILTGKRLIHCHSYRQDEILMLCRVAGEFGFRIGTFQHGLEGYKVAEAIEKNAIGASIFSDWWAYKYEVVDAIPENAAIMHRVGVNVSFNSDSNELARRMNLEAAKAVKYGGLDPAEALHLVTINPAKQLQVDGRIGSLEGGKDGDFVVWSGDPLSSFSRCLQTWIDGRRYWSADRDAALQDEANTERQRLIQKILDGDFDVVATSDSESLDNKPGECECSATGYVEGRR